MKITTQPCQPRPDLLLGEVPAGTVVRFPKTFSQRHNRSDIFIVNAVCNTYVPESVKRNSNYPHQYDKYAPARNTRYAGMRQNGSKLHAMDMDEFGSIGVTNLRTGSLSYVTEQRVCVAVKTEVCYTGDEEV